MKWKEPMHPKQIKKNNFFLIAKNGFSQIKCLMKKKKSSLKKINKGRR